MNIKISRRDVNFKPSEMEEKRADSMRKKGYSINKIIKLQKKKKKRILGQNKKEKSG